MASKSGDNFQNQLKSSLKQKNISQICCLLDKVTFGTDSDSGLGAFAKFCDTYCECESTRTATLCSLDTASHGALFSNGKKFRNKSLSFVQSKIEDSADGINIFDLVLEPGYEKIVFFLMQRSPNLICNDDGDTILHIVAREKLSLLLDLLVYSSWLPVMMSFYNKNGHLPLHIAALSYFHRYFHLFHQHNKSSVAAGLSNQMLETDSNRNRSRTSRRNIERELQNEFKKKHQDSTVSQFSCCETEIDQEILTKGQCKSVYINCKTLCKKIMHFHHSDTDRREGETCLTLLWDKFCTLMGSIQELNEIFYMCQVLIRAGARGVLRKRKIAEKVCRTFFELSPLHAAAGMGCLENIKLLLRVRDGADPQLCLEPDCKLAVQLALQNGHNRVSLALLDPLLVDLPDTLITHVDHCGNTLFHSAVTAPHTCNVQVLEQLYILGCPLDRPNSNDMRPLDLAICSVHLPTVHFILQTKPELVNVHLYQDSRIYPPLLRASTSPTASLTLCKILLSYGADINACGYQKNHVTACYRAFKFACFETGVFLCENSSRPFSMIERKYLLLQVENKESNCVERLKQRLKSVPTLALTCLDTIRQAFIMKYHSFQQVELLPLPRPLIKALRYERDEGSLT